MGTSTTTQQSSYTLKANKKNKHADLEIYGVIGSWWGANHRDFNHELKSLGNIETISVRLNTIGGTFYDGLPIFNILKQHPAVVTVKVMGYALSMGSIIMLSADHVEMAQNSLIMIHRAQGYAYGDAKEMKSVAERLEMHEEAIIPLYQNRLKLSEEAVLELLQNETWYSAKRALKAGLIDAITDPIDLEEATKQIDENAWKECIGGQCNMPKNHKQLVQSVIENSGKSLIEKALEFAIGKPDPQITPLENKQEELDMTKEELQQMLDDQAEKLTNTFDEKLAEFKKEEGGEVEENASTKEEDDNEIKVLRDELAAAKAEIAELSKPANDTTKIPENTGDSEDKTYSC